jgi:hypothetical protein
VVRNCTDDLEILSSYLLHNTATEVRASIGYILFLYIIPFLAHLRSFAKKSRHTVSGLRVRMRCLPPRITFETIDGFYETCYGHQSTEGYHASILFQFLTRNEISLAEGRTFEMDASLLIQNSAGLYGKILSRI